MAGKCIDEFAPCITEKSVNVMLFYILHKGMHYMKIIKVFIIGFIFNVMNILINYSF